MEGEDEGEGPIGVKAAVGSMEMLRGSRLVAVGMSGGWEIGAAGGKVREGEGEGEAVK